MSISPVSRVKAVCKGNQAPSTIPNSIINNSSSSSSKCKIHKSWKTLLSKSRMKSTLTFSINMTTMRRSSSSSDIPWGAHLKWKGGTLYPRSRMKHWWGYKRGWDAWMLFLHQTSHRLQVEWESMGNRITQRAHLHLLRNELTLCKVMKVLYKLSRALSMQGESSWTLLSRLGRVGLPVS